jgi:hypothetical protein
MDARLRGHDDKRASGSLDGVEALVAAIETTVDAN